ncbi:MAG: Rrf2 family transcriptional regulator [Sphingopyxis sp.]|nr:Rrf2 family transcriptional regulator [Sphingopyxis sp.]
MQLTRFTDYSIRVLIHVASRRDGELSSIQEIADAYDISRNHLMKVVVDLGRAGFLETIRGRGGGLRLGRPAETINLGALVRHTEQSLQLVDCSTCLIAPACVLPRILAEATRAFLAVLDRYTLADLLRDRADDLRALFAADLAPSRPAPCPALP